ncbi:MAG: amidohydrolase family protein [Pseudomonadales bacterium]|nr:amidohydrolase family protein [Pseudomonadales bacterium]MDG1443335.1 amidohydrolase family protein [Pseudomonadales bacterium]
MNNSQWLDQIKEETLEPELPICDPHHHLWDHPGSRYLLDELQQDTGTGHNICSTVFVECSSMYRAQGPVSLAPIGETEFVQGIAAMSASGQYGSTRVASGIVSFADLSLGDDVKGVLESHMAASTNRFRGIRHATGWHKSKAIRNSHSRPTEGLMSQEGFQQGFSHLAPLGLSFDAWFYHEQMPEFVALAKAFPETQIVLDHFGGPLGVGPYENKADEVLRQWRDLVEPLKNLGNVHFKLGGINMKVNGFNWHKRPQPPSSDELVDLTAPYYEHCIKIFGAQRCMFESNFPVDKDSCSYQVLWNAFKKMSQTCTPNERAALFHDTATRFYRLSESNTG